MRTLIEEKPFWPTDDEHRTLDDLKNFVQSAAKVMLKFSNGQLLSTVHSLCAAIDRNDRRLQLSYPATKEEFERALWWMIEEGNDQDLLLLREVRRRSPYSSPQIERLFDQAERRIVARMGHMPHFPLSPVMIEEPPAQLPSPDSKNQASVRKIISQLLSPDGKDRVELATELGQLGVDERGSTRPRGSSEAAAPSRLPEPDSQALIGLLHDPNPEVRSEVALALGEWGGESAAPALAKLLQSDPDKNVQSYCVTALGLIGGPTAKRALQWAAEHVASTAVQGEALAALEEIDSGGVLDLAEG